jgi:hypothetical protein
MRTSLMLIQPLHILMYKDLSLEHMLGHKIIRYFSFSEQFLIYMRI